MRTTRRKRAPASQVTSSSDEERSPAQERYEIADGDNDNIGVTELGEATSAAKAPTTKRIRARKMTYEEAVGDIRGMFLKQAEVWKGFAETLEASDDEHAVGDKTTDWRQETTLLSTAPQHESIQNAIKGLKRKLEAVSNHHVNDQPEAEADSLCSIQSFDDEALQPTNTEAV